MTKIRFVCIIFLLVVMLGVISQQTAANNTSDENPAVVIEADKTAEPISSYIYGQFIEHLGRCIYGGIWAEMLEDRKFYYEIDTEKSPWSSVGPKDAVSMTRRGSYVGRHSPKVQLAGDGKRCGISQGKLALIKGKEYTGRVVIAGDPKAAPIEIDLIWSQETGGRQTVLIEKINSDFVKIPLRFEVPATTNYARLEIVGLGEGSFRIGAVSLMPADNIDGLRPDTLKLLKELNSPIYRWPGGNFVSGYDWRDGIGADRDKRAPKKNLAWNDVESNDFGIHEFMAFCRELDTEPMMTVNSGFGDAYTAAQELEYINGRPETPMGQLRTANGHREPYNVVWWCIGNEMYGPWQLGCMALKHYVIKHNLFVEAMRKVDPSIKAITVGQAGEWSEGILNSCAEYTDIISEHFYCGQKDSVAEHVPQIAGRVNSIVAAHRDFRKRLETLKGKNIPIAIDEWNYWSGKRGLYYLRDALGIAKGLHEMIRNSDIVFMANYAQTVNVLGAIKTSKTDAVFQTNGLVLKLYRRHFGTLPVAVTGDARELDVVAAWTSGRKNLTIAIVNPTEKQRRLAFDLKAAQLAGTGRLWLIAHSDPMACNEPGKEPQVTIEEKPITGIANTLNIPPLSICLYELPVR
ncbi:MAG: alpha-L-arabinofuranosidase C-terminal domain-containing protein [Planctomycetota bacterium]|jgi:alpha-N-arabinofuranosidase